MGISVLVDKVVKELKVIWQSEADLPENMPAGLGGQTIPKNQVSTFVFIILILILAGIFWNAAANTDTTDLPSGGSGGANVELNNAALDPINGHSDENSEQHVNVSVEEKAIATINFTLTWEDEDPSEPGMQNDPDEFQINATTPWGEVKESDMKSNQQGEKGEVSIEFESEGEYPDTGAAGDYDVVVKMGEAGDVGPMGIPSIGQNDNGNDWTLTVTYTYWQEASSSVEE